MNSISRYEYEYHTHSITISLTLKLKRLVYPLYFSSLMNIENFINNNYNNNNNVKLQIWFNNINC